MTILARAPKPPLHAKRIPPPISGGSLCKPSQFLPQIIRIFLHTYTTHKPNLHAKQITTSYQWGCPRLSPGTFLHRSCVYSYMIYHYIIYYIIYILYILIYDIHIFNIYIYILYIILLSLYIL